MCVLLVEYCILVKVSGISVINGRRLFSAFGATMAYLLGRRDLTEAVTNSNSRQLGVIVALSACRSLKSCWSLCWCLEVDSSCSVFGVVLSDSAIAVWFQWLGLYGIWLDNGLEH